MSDFCFVSNYVVVNSVEPQSWFTKQEVATVFEIYVVATIFVVKRIDTVIVIGTPPPI